jgi:hypothetical protein
MFADLDDVPVTLVLDDMAALYRYSAHTIRRQLHEGSFRPLPFANHPLRWRKEDVVRDLEQRAAAAQHAHNGNGRKTPARRRRPRR